MKKHNGLLVSDGKSFVRCRICDHHFCSDTVEEEVEYHEKKHEQLANGGLPYKVREFLKSYGWNLAHGNTDNQEDDEELGKLAVAYSHWTRAKMNGIDSRQFDDFMIERLHFIDAIVENDQEKLGNLQETIRKWEKYGG